MSERIFVELPDSADPIPCDIWEDPDPRVIALLRDEVDDVEATSDQRVSTGPPLTLRESDAEAVSRLFDADLGAEIADRLIAKVVERLKS